jgi:hypothetical protein
LGAYVTFEPGAWTAWHAHASGQTLIVTAGFVRVQRWDGPIEEIRPGEVVWIEPGEKHWHGATPTTAMRHFTVVEKAEEDSPGWMEHLSNEQYLGKRRKHPMIAWTNEELDKIGTAEELRIATLRRDGTLRKRVIIWVARVGDDLYVRCVNGREGVWFHGVLTQHEGRIWAGGVEKDVKFVEETDPETNDKIDETYLTKYQRYPQWVAPMVTPEVRAATIKLVPRPVD